LPGKTAEERRPLHGVLESKIASPKLHSSTEVPRAK
jgi:hypothetical protein